MRTIQLPTQNTVSFSLSAEELNAPGILMPNGLQHISMGKLRQEDFKALEVARTNGSTIMWATICLEQKLERILVNYFMGPFTGPCERRELFENEVIRSSSFQLSFKKHLIEKVATELGVISGKERSKLQGALKKVILWRNAFAHGNLKLSAKRGVVLCFYAGSHKEQVLNEEYWLLVEETYENCNSLLKKLESATTSTKRGT